jgi:hypothetical protein
LSLAAPTGSGITLVAANAQDEYQQQWTTASPSTLGTYFNSGAGLQYFGMFSNHGMLFLTNSSAAMRLSSAGALQLNTYGAGTLTTDASGNVTAVSDLRLKTNVRPFTKGLAALRALPAPIMHGYTVASGLDQQRDDYAGFGLDAAFEAVLPEAVGRMKVVRDATPTPEAAARIAQQAAALKAWEAQEEKTGPRPVVDVLKADDVVVTYDPDPPRTFSERALLALLVNAVKELAAEVEALRAAR